MKRILSLLLASTLIFSLVACNNEKNTSSNIDTSTTITQTETESTDNTKTTDSSTTDESSSDTKTPSNSKPTTSNKDNTTSNKPSNAINKPTISMPSTPPAKDTTTPTESIQTPTDEPDKSPADEPSDCEHTYTTVSCTMPKMCTKCHHIAGKALPHNYKNGSCTICGRAEMLVTFQEGDWVARTVKNGTSEQGEILSEYILKQNKRTYENIVCYSNASSCVMNVGKVVYNEKTYYADFYPSSLMSCAWEENGNTITVSLEHTDPIIEFVLTKTSETQLTVISSTNTAYVPVGIVFVKQ